MSEKSEQDKPLESIEALYADAANWHVNTGGETIHAKRMDGRFRRIKWLTAASWIFYLLAPYLRWNGQQAILFDVPHRQFHLFALTIWPQDIWLLSLVLIFFAITLFAVTAVAGRIWCGYFCFQTVWTDIFTWIEEKIEGNPQQRRKLDAAPWDARKLGLKLAKHTLWLVIAVVTGVTFSGYFYDIFQLWHDYLTLQVPLIAWVVMAAFIFGTYVFAGLMREQVCFWLCPYARIQSVMVDRNSVIPTYDFRRGEPRGRARSGAGDCVDCQLCIGVCPTGVDIRNGLQEGCINCGLCLDACDSVMVKVGKPPGLIRYASENEILGQPTPPFFKRPRVLVYGFILLLAAGGILYGLTHIQPLQLTVLHERQPLFIRMSDGSIANKYTLTAVNKTGGNLPVQIRVEGLEGATVEANDGAPVVLTPEMVMPFRVLVRTRPEQLKGVDTPIRFVLESAGETQARLEYESVFVGPAN
ncbi:MAG: cytochrome c oxidase accessory protein CcoG [Nitrosomonadales bacterium]|nr:cytochrome c oxidase accessory protein CcoG [Nitrosomonadales bacterium]